MKLAPFQYAAPTTVAEAVALLGSCDAKALSGGQSLMPILAFRLAAPELLVDLKHVQGLDRIVIDATGVTLGAKVRWCDIEGDARLAVAHPLLAEAIKHVAHYQIRNRGTVGGSLAHADPAAEMPGIAVACDAVLTLVGPKGARKVAAADFFEGALQTCLAPDELITEVLLPVWPKARRWGFQEFARRRGDFALAGIAAFYDVDSEGRAANTHIGVIGASDRPRRLALAEAAFDGKPASPDSIAAAAHAASLEVDPPSDIHAPADYRRALVETMVERALTHAAR
jgi:aerobic carbon-monoxide dehydrogenase medium subunit